MSVQGASSCLCRWWPAVARVVQDKTQLTGTDAYIQPQQPQRQRQRNDHGNDDHDHHDDHDDHSDENDKNDNNKDNSSSGSNNNDNNKDGNDCFGFLESMQSWVGKPITP